MDAVSDDDERKKKETDLEVFGSAAVAPGYATMGWCGKRRVLALASRNPGTLITRWLNAVTLSIHHRQHHALSKSRIWT